MAGVDVLGCIAGIVSAFHGATDLIQTIKQRNERRRRMHGAAQDPEQAFEEKMLLKSLSDGEVQCKSSRDEKYKRYGAAFKAGDTDALSALKDVMMSLQMDIISSLQVARAVENAKLDYSRLHEAAIMNKNATLRAMEDLCKRLPAVESDDIDEARDRSTRTRDSPGEVRLTGVDRPLAVSLPTPPASPRRPPLPRANPSKSSLISPTSPPSRSARSERSFSASQTSPQSEPPQVKQMKAAPPKKRGFAKMFSGFSASLTMANDDYSAFNREADDLRTKALDEAEEQRKSPDPEQMVRLSLNDSGFGGSETSLRHRATASISSTLFSEDRQSSTADSFFEQPHGLPRNDSETLPVISLSPDPGASSSSILSDSQTSSTGKSNKRPTPLPLKKFDVNDMADRAMHAPEVVTPGFEPMLRPSSRLGSAPPSETSVFRSVHPAFRDAWMADPTISPPEADDNWAPLRPTKLNAYHNFCKGAWQIRDRVEEGLSVAMMPTRNGTTVPYWKCKQCQFRSKVANNARSLPNHIYVIPGGIRYRWLFLAKSHMHAEELQSKLEAYSYGCVFCCAEGRESAVHSSVDALMSHIVSKHKPSMMTPEVRQKTRCIIEGVEDVDDDWDIDLPESHKRKLGGVFMRR